MKKIIALIFIIIPLFGAADKTGLISKELQDAYDLILSKTAELGNDRRSELFKLLKSYQYFDFLGLGEQEIIDKILAYSGQSNKMCLTGNKLLQARIKSYLMGKNTLIADKWQYLGKINIKDIRKQNLFLFDQEIIKQTDKNSLNTFDYKNILTQIPFQKIYLESLLGGYKIDEILEIGKTSNIIFIKLKVLNAPMPYLFYFMNINKILLIPHESKQILGISDNKRYFYIRDNNHMPMQIWDCIEERFIGELDIYKKYFFTKNLTIFKSNGLLIVQDATSQILSQTQLKCKDFSKSGGILFQDKKQNIKFIDLTKLTYEELLNIEQTINNKSITLEDAKNKFDKDNVSIKDNYITSSNGTFLTIWAKDTGKIIKNLSLNKKIKLNKIKVKDLFLSNDTSLLVWVSQYKIQIIDLNTENIMISIDQSKIFPDEKYGTYANTGGQFLREYILKKAFLTKDGNNIIFTADNNFCKLVFSINPNQTDTK